MELKQIFLAQLEREAAATRRTLEHVPEGRNEAAMKITRRAIRALTREL